MRYNADMLNIEAVTTALTIAIDLSALLNPVYVAESGLEAENIVWRMNDQIDVFNHTSHPF